MDVDRPSEPAINSLRCRLPLGLLGMCVLVAVIEWALHRQPHAFATVWSAAWSRVGREASKDTRGRDVLFFGDSLVMQGVVPAVISAETGRTCRNLAVFKGLSPASYVLLERALRAGARPSVVAIDGELLCDDPHDIGRLWPELYTWSETVALARDTRDPWLVTDVVLGKLLPTLRDRYEIQEAVQGALAGTPRDPWVSLAKHLRNWRQNDGANLIPPDSRFPVDANKFLEERRFWPTEWKCHRTNEIYIDKFLDLAESKGIAVCWLLPPVHPELQRRRDAAGLSAHYERFIRELQREHPTLHVIDARHCGFPEAVFADLSHLNRNGAVAYSTLLGNELRSRSGSRARREAGPWIALAQFRGVPTTTSEVEDLDQSGKALRQAAREIGRTKR